MLTYVLTFLAGAAAVVVFEFAWLNQLLAPFQDLFDALSGLFGSM